MSRLPRWPQLATLLVLALALGYLAWLGWGLAPSSAPAAKAGFDGDRALTIAEDLCAMGPRPAGSPQGWKTGAYILQQLQTMGLKTSHVDFTAGSAQLRNIAAMLGDSGPLLVVATHYDTRLVADLDPDPAKRQLPSPGANDGASGVAVLLELARTLDASQLQHRVWLVFLDGEANAGVPDWEGQLGSKYFLDGRHPAGAIYLNMVGAADARFPQAPDANELLQTQLWKLAAKLGHDDIFITEMGPSIADAHAVFLQAGIPTAEIIQPDYPYARTSEDACDKLDAATLKAVGVLLESYIENNDFLTIAPSLKTKPAK